MKLIYFNHFQVSLMAFAVFFGFSLQLNAQKDSEKSSPHYIFPTFTKGSVVMKDGNTKQAILNYNTVTQEMIFEQYGKRLALDKLETIDTVIIQDRKFIPVGEVFYEVALVASISLFIQHKSDLISEGKPIGYGTKKQTTSSTIFSKLIAPDGLYPLKLPDEFYVINTSVNWIQKDESMVKFITKRQFLKIFKEQENKLKQFIKENKINLKVSEDIIMLVNYCNELVL
ncbi:MAG: hypothetical protein GH151_11245 [Bacteroidetes bacterium]|nr:hypothetical protein [Bacteroidota bacterium]